MRYQIKPNHRCTVPANHVAFDCETVPVPLESDPDVQQHNLMMGCATAWRWEGGIKTRREQLEFYQPSQFWAWLLTRTHKRMPLYVWSHWLAYDLTTLRFWHQLEDGVFRLFDPAPPEEPGRKRATKRKAWRGALVTDDPPTLVVCRTADGAEVNFVDTLNWFGCKLEELGREVGLEKLERPGEAGDDFDWLDYCKRDVDIVEATVDAIREMVKDNDLGNFQPTIAGQSMHFFRHRCMDRPIRTTDDAGVKALERAAYYGGRREVYFRGAVLPPDKVAPGAFYNVEVDMPIIDKGPVYQVDVQSCYPAMMAGHDYPTAFVKRVQGMSAKELRQHLRGSCAVAEVVLDSGDEPWPYKDGSQTKWARGRIRTVLCGPELIRALDMGCVSGVGDVQLYVKDRPFDTFVREVTALRDKYRKAGKALHAKVAKLLGNALHGRLAMKQHKWELAPGVKTDVPWGFFVRYHTETGALHTYRSIGRHAQEQLPAVEVAGSFPLIAAYCTAYAREFMRTLRIKAGLRDTLYEDCDSLHVTQAGYDALRQLGYVADDQVGKLKVECTSDVAVYKAYRDYRIGDKRVLAGLAHKAWMEPCGLWHQIEFMRLDALLMANPPAGPLSTERKLVEPAPICRGKVNKDGWVDPVCVYQ